LRDYLDALEREGLFRWVDSEVDKDWEIASMSRMLFRAYAEEQRYGLGFRNIPGISRRPGEASGGTKGAKVIIDATKKWDYPEVSLPPRELLDRVVENWAKYELPPLRDIRLPGGL
jgi:3-polyprenyl-4-hydroxybenzoate decarboxylase